MLTTNVDMDYKESIQNLLGGRFPFRSEPPKQFNIAFNNESNQWRQELHIAKYGGADLRGHGYTCRLFSIQKKASLTLRRLAMPNNSNQSHSIQNFQHSQFGKLGLITVEGQEWFKLVDVCKTLNLSNSTVVAGQLDDDERAKLNLGRQGKAWFINESGLYSVILRSDKPNAKPFRKWVTSKVLPAIRKTGGYEASIHCPKSIKPKRPALPHGSDFRESNNEGIYFYEPMTQYGRIPVGILHGINTAAQTFVTEAVIKEALRRRIKMCEKKLANEFWLKLGKESLKTHDTTGEALYRLLEVDRELSIGNLEIAMSDIFRKYWE